MTLARVACLLAWLTAATSACSGPADPAPVSAAASAATCAPVLPSRCPPHAPTYQGEVAAIFSAHCTKCHNGTTLADSEATYADVYARRSAILDQVNACTMPPEGTTLARPLDDAERRAMLEWLVCDAPND